MNLNDYIVNVFCKTDDFMKKYFPERTLSHRGPIPQLADSEILTMEIVGEIIGLETDKTIFKFFKRFYFDYFPKLSCRVTFARQSAKLQTFYGFRLHIKINSIGMIQSFDLTAANIHDIHMVEELTAGDRGLLLADRAYLSQPLKQQLLEHQAPELSVPTKYGEPTELNPKQLGFRKRLRGLIETVGNQLTNNLHMKKIWVRDLWHLTNRICREILAHTFYVLFCLRKGIKPLCFSKLITV